MTSIEFFKSQWNELRCGAALFIGHALGNVPPEKKLSVNLNPAIISSGKFLELFFTFYHFLIIISNDIIAQAKGSGS